MVSKGSAGEYPSMHRAKAGNTVWTGRQAIARPFALSLTLTVEAIKSLEST